MNSLFGSADIVVSKDNEFVFLEINESGQFLFLEQLCPDLPILDAFSDFLVSDIDGFFYDSKTENNVTMKQYLSSPENRIRENKVEKRGWFPGNKKL